MFKKIAIFGFLGVFVLGGLFLASDAKGQVCGDVDGSGVIDVTDMLMLINYLFGGAPGLPNMCNADMDNNPGVDMGDLFQLIGVLYGFCPALYCCNNGAPMNDAPGPSGFDFFTASFLPGQTGAVLPIFYVNNCTSPIYAVSFPFSYAPVCGLPQTSVTLNSITRSFPPGWQSGAVFNNFTQTGFIWGYDQTFTTPLPNGLIATLNYTSTAGTDAWLTESIYPPRHTLFGVTMRCSTGPTAPGVRIITPRALFYVDGDVNCDGILDIGDIVYVINYVFYGGPVPCTDWQ